MVFISNQTHKINYVKKQSWINPDIAKTLGTKFLDQNYSKLFQNVSDEIGNKS